jgi:thymidylate synthase (FAD)
MPMAVSSHCENAMSGTISFGHLRWKQFPVGSGGSVCLVDVMGTDSDIVQAARISYNKDSHDVNDLIFKAVRKRFTDGPSKEEGAGYIFDEDTKRDWSREQWEAARNDVFADERTLLRYLIRHQHGTPFEMVEVKILIQIPMDAWRQFVRHRTFNINEYSTRYTEAIDDMATTPVDGWRLQSATNKQGSAENIKPTGDSTGIAENLTRLETEFHKKAREVYQHRLNCGVAREQARKDLPLSTYTRAYVKCDLRNWFHFLGLRMDSHAQKEIRDFATTIGEQIIAPLFPMAWEAFQDYHPNMGGMLLSRLDVEVSRFIDANPYKAPEVIYEEVKRLIPNGRERSECFSKLFRIGSLPAAWYDEWTTK